ncbi:MAG TPA: EamA family transporter [Deltaproteobacteria bacterium]|jgi:drug/metabolite transporter (DMT)-like permease|nr:EamA family transporter [Deltaproteobacteria bacterium]
MIPPEILGTVFALLSAAAWGTGDFSGGVATRGTDQYRVVFLMTLPGILVIGLIAVGLGEPFPPPKDLFWAVCAGSCGTFGIASLYRGLSIGNAAIVAPTGAVVGAGLPIAFSSLKLGLPGTNVLLGFLLAIIGIWFVSRPGKVRTDGYDKGLKYGIASGVCFGGYFIFMGQVQQGLVFGPITFAKTASLVITAVILFSRREQISGFLSNPLALLAGVFDAGGNAFYMLARQHTRLDVAAVLSSMYPIVTVVLARLILREKVSTAQWCGVALCMAAVALITM